MNGIYVWIIVKIWKCQSYPPFWNKNKHQNYSYSRSYPHSPHKMETFVVEQKKKWKNKTTINIVKKVKSC